jgi:putative signal transducing protein
MSILTHILSWFDGSNDAPARLPSPDEAVVLVKPNGEAEAQLFHDMLEQEGIRSMVRNTDAASARAGGMGPAWAYELLVLRKDLHRAREILDLDEGS